MPVWIERRADRLKADLQKQYGKKKGEQVAFAIATQMAHRLGKSPKTFKSKVTGKKESFGTPQARREAKAKFDKPLKEYQKTASVASAIAQAALRRGAVGGAVGGVGGAGLAALSAQEGERLRAALKGGAVGAGIGAAGGAVSGALPVLNTLQRAAKQSGKTLKTLRARDLTDSAEHIGDQLLYTTGPYSAGLLGVGVGGAQTVKKRKKKTAEEEIMVPAIVSDLALDILEKQAKFNIKAIGTGLKKGVKKVVGTAPGGANPLNPGSGIKGAIGRLTTPM